MIILNKIKLDHVCGIRRRAGELGKGNNSMAAERGVEGPRRGLIVADTGDEVEGRWRGGAVLNRAPAI